MKGKRKLLQRKWPSLACALLFASPSFAHSGFDDPSAEQADTAPAYLFGATTEWTQPSLAKGFDPSEPYTPLARFENSTYFVWVDAAQRAWLTQVTDGVATVAPLDNNPDYLVQADGHHRFSLGVDKQGFVHVVGDMHHYSTFSDKVITPYPERYRNQTVLYWKSNKARDISGGFSFAGAKGSASAIPGGGWMMGRFFTDNQGELYHSSMAHAYESPSTGNKGQMAVGLYKYATDTKTWTAIGGLAELPKDPYLTNVAKVFYWENAGMNGGWFQNYQARFQFDANNRLHFVMSANTDSTFAGANRLFYAVSPDGGTTWRKADGTKIAALPLRGLSTVANTADVVVDTGLAYSFEPGGGLAIDAAGNPAVSARISGRSGTYWYSWDGSSWTANDKLSAAQPWGTPQLAYRTPTPGELFFATQGSGFISTTMGFDQAFYTYGVETPQAGSLSTPDEATLRTTGDYYAVFTTGTNASPSIVRISHTAAPLPTGWSDQDLTGRSPAYKTKAAFAGNAFTLYDFGTGNGQKDDVHFTSLPLKCDGTLIARVAANTTPVPSTPEAGLMMRESMDLGARHVTVAAIPAKNQYRFAYRSTVDNWPIEKNTTAEGAPRFIRLQRKGNVFSGAMSSDGQTWSELGQTTMALGSDLVVGLYGAARQHGYYMQTARFDHVSLQSTCTNYPPLPVCVRRAPKITLAPEALVLPRGATVRFKVSVTNNDSVECSASDFNQVLSSNAPREVLSLQVGTEKPTLKPGASITTNLGVTASLDAPLGAFTVTDTVKNSSAEGSTAVAATAQAIIIPR